MTAITGRYHRRARRRRHRRRGHIIEAYGYDLARRPGRLPSAEEVAADWYDTEDRPGLDEIRRAGLFERHASLDVTEADHFLWVYKQTTEERRRGRSRREIRRGDGRPLPARAATAPDSTDLDGMRP